MHVLLRCVMSMRLFTFAGIMQQFAKNTLFEIANVYLLTNYRYACILPTARAVSVWIYLAQCKYSAVAANLTDTMLFNRTKKPQNCAFP